MSIRHRGCSMVDPWQICTLYFNFVRLSTCTHILCACAAHARERHNKGLGSRLLSRTSSASAINHRRHCRKPSTAWSIFALIPEKFSKRVEREAEEEMGQSLSEPKTDKDTHSLENEHFVIGCSCMQGWRPRIL